ncbi:MAG: hypothetical protein CK540_02920 [Thermoleophilia bacterium]|nr:MAG: hypothetical protein CK540_02920 [Thermoleophilia bacterium]
MADHADHHHAVAEKPNASTTMGIALFFSIVALLVSFISAIRASYDFLTVGLVLGAIGLGVGVLGVVLAKAKRGTTRGFALVLFLSVIVAALWALVGSNT